MALINANTAETTKGNTTKLLARLNNHNTAILAPSSQKEKQTAFQQIWTTSTTNQRHLHHQQ